MEKRNRLVLLCIGAILCLAISAQAAYAYDTTVNLGLSKDYNLSVYFNVNSPFEYKTLYSTQVYSENKEKMVFNFTTDTNAISFYIIAYLGDVKLKSKKFDNQTAGGTISLYLFEPLTSAASNTSSSAITGNAVATGNATANNSAVSNTSAENTTLSSTASNPTDEKSESLSSLSIEDNKALLWVGYGVGGIIIIAVIIVLLKWIISFIRSKTSMPLIRNRINFGDDLNVPLSNKKKEDVIISKELTEAEEKIKEAQAKIEAIKNRESLVSEAEKKFEESKRELERLRGY